MIKYVNYGKTGNDPGCSGPGRCIHCHSFTQSSFTPLTALCASPLQLSLSSQPLATTDLYALSLVLPFPECHIVGIIQDVAFSCLLLSHFQQSTGTDSDEMFTTLSFPHSLHFTGRSRTSVVGSNHSTVCLPHFGQRNRL